SYPVLLHRRQGILLPHRRLPYDVRRRACYRSRHWNHADHERQRSGIVTRFEFNRKEPPCTNHLTYETPSWNTSTLTPLQRSSPLKPTAKTETSTGFSANCGPARTCCLHPIAISWTSQRDRPTPRPFSG